MACHWGISKWKGVMCLEQWYSTSLSSRLDEQCPIPLLAIFGFGPNPVPGAGAARAPSGSPGGQVHNSATIQPCGERWGKGHHPPHLIVWRGELWPGSNPPQKARDFGSGMVWQYCHYSPAAKFTDPCEAPWVRFQASMGCFWPTGWRASMLGPD